MLLTIYNIDINQQIACCMILQTVLHCYYLFPSKFSNKSITKLLFY